MSFMTERLFQLLESHRIYENIFSPKTLRIFMEHHVICVWSYHALLKSLQKDLLSNQLPLVSDELKEAIHLISEITLEEEVEAQIDGSFQSHLELYLDAMIDTDCDTSPVMEFFRQLEQGIPIHKALRHSGFSKSVIDYGDIIVRYLDMNPHEKAAAMFYEGEPFIPDQFLVNLEQKVSQLNAHGLIDYFERHIEGLKRPGFSASGRLVEILCRGYPELEKESEKIAQKTMKYRLMLWDAIQSILDEENCYETGNSIRPKLRLVSAQTS